MATMTVQRLHELFEENPGKDILSWNGTCHDCGETMEVSATPMEDGIHITGGSVYEPTPQSFFLKCDACFQKDPRLRNFQKCEVYSRVVGYLRPVSQWNEGKQAEFNNRITFDVAK